MNIQPDIINSVPLESLFSTAGEVNTDQRLRLIFENAEMPIFLYVAVALLSNVTRLVRTFWTT